jgi:hypothetical protein
MGMEMDPLLNLVVKVEDPNKSQLPAEISRELFLIEIGSPHLSPQVEV